MVLTSHLIVRKIRAHEANSVGHINTNLIDFLQNTNTLDED